MLWHYLAEPQAAEQVSYLLKFFEGHAQFATTVQLSACIADRAFFDVHKSAWFGANRAGRQGVSTDGFGQGFGRASSPPYSGSRGAEEGCR